MEVELAAVMRLCVELIDGRGWVVDWCVAWDVLCPLTATADEECGIGSTVDPSGTAECCTEAEGAKGEEEEEEAEEGAEEAKEK